jgi:ABC-type multidrug transport system permease subunit
MSIFFDSFVYKNFYYEIFCRARFRPQSNEVWIAIGIIMMIVFASAGVGMLVGSLIKNIHGTIMTGVGIAVVTAAISGIMAPYYALPSILQKVFSPHFSQITVNSKKWGL